MIRSLRRRHFWMIVVVGTFTGLLVVLGLLSRQPVPTVPMPDSSDRTADDRPASVGDR